VLALLLAPGVEMSVTAMAVRGYLPVPGEPDAMGDVWSEEAVRNLEEFRGDVYVNYDHEKILGKVMHSYRARGHHLFSGMFIVDLADSWQSLLREIGVDTTELAIGPAIVVHESALRGEPARDEDGEQRRNELGYPLDSNGNPIGFDLIRTEVMYMGIKDEKSTVADHV
jgi:hypothetical protein